MIEPSAPNILPLFNFHLSLLVIFLLRNGSVKPAATSAIIKPIKNTKGIGVNTAEMIPRINPLRIKASLSIGVFSLSMVVVPFVDLFNLRNVKYCKLKKERRQPGKRGDMAGVSPRTLSKDLHTGTFFINCKKMLFSYGNMHYYIKKSIKGNCNLNQSKKVQQCHECGMTSSIVELTGRVGCSRCYYHLHEAVYGYIEKHLCAILEETGSMDIVERLHKAVNEENYELAAILRDQIKSYGKSEGGDQ